MKTKLQRRPSRLASALLAVLAVGVFLFVWPVQAATFVVTNTAAGGPGSLRQAILDANSNAGYDRINFSIPGSGVRTITPTNALPQITDPVFIDGTTQPGYTNTPLILLNGASAGGSANGLLLLAGSSTVRGLAINRFALAGLRIEAYGSNVIQRMFLGTDPTGTTAVGNGDYGLVIFNSPGNQIGGTTTNVANVLSSNRVSGLYILGAGAVGNRVEGNFVGTDVTGRVALSNGINGILISGASGNYIGGAAAGSGNVISGNGQSGIYCIGLTAKDNWFLRNYVGTDVTGTNALGNREDGITLYDSPSNHVGAPGLGNLVSGNRSSGISVAYSSSNTTISGNYVGTDATGRRALPNRRSGITLLGVERCRVGTPEAGGGNLASGNAEAGIWLSDAAARRNVIQGNKIGTDFTGTNALPNSMHGISISGSNNVVGGSWPGQGNLISGNAQNGIFFNGWPATGNVVHGNYIGVAVSGGTRLANQICGIYLYMSPGNQIGGTSAGMGNVISGNLSTGLLVLGTPASNNIVQGNLIGTDATGQYAIANGLDGVGISQGSFNLIGGAASGARNLISGNTNSGVYISSAVASSNTIAGNFVGADLLGRRSVPNGAEGVFLAGPGSILGGTAWGAGNLISGGGSVGISVADPTTTNTVIQGNWIGVQSDGFSPLGNSLHGVVIQSSASRTVVGGTGLRAANRITYARTALYAGVRVMDGCNYNTIRANTIYSNAALGIDLGANGVTANRAGAGPGPSSSANFGQNYPVLSSATNRFRTVIQGTLGSVSNQVFTLDFYVNSLGDANGYGEGQQWLGALSVTTSAAGLASFTALFTNTVPVTGWVCATATDAAGNTSEFSANVPVATGSTGDTDGDGMPDDYEVAWGFNPGSPADANLDADGDGFTNLQEYRSGTNPRDAADYFCIMTSYFDGRSVWSSFDARTGRRYVLLRGPTTSGPWQSISTNIPFACGQAWLVDTNPTVLPTRFYRLKCEP